ncbi:MAG: GDYXXLXY domain-containing protein [Chitinophagaceae bacterium]
MKQYKKAIIIINLVCILGYFAYAVYSKETILKKGKLVLLELAPVDPRSLMQGDYMALRYAITQNLDADKMPKRGYCVVQLDSFNVAKKIRFQKNTTPVNKGEYIINYTSTDYFSVHIGAESFFFQEGDAEKFENAKFGGVMIDNNGNSLLVGLFNQQHQQIQ